MIQTAIHSFLPQEIRHQYLDEYQPKNQRVALIATFILMIVAGSSLGISFINNQAFILNIYNKIYLVFGALAFCLFTALYIGRHQKRPLIMLAALVTVQAMVICLTYNDIMTKQSIIALILSSFAFATIYQFQRLTYMLVYVLPFGLLVTALLLKDGVSGFYFMELIATFTVSFVLAFMCENFRRESFHKSATIEKQMTTIRSEKAKNQDLLSQLTDANIKLKQQVIDRTKAEKMAQKASAAKSLFLANMSHELRTPLNGISGALHLLQSGTSKKDRQDIIEIGLTSIHALTRIINDILDLSKIESGKFNLIESSANPAALIKRLDRTYSLLAGEKGIDFHVKSTQACDQTMVLDHVRLEQICANLLSNAIKFTAKGSVTLFADCVPQSDSEYRLDFKITDTGAGINPGDQEKLFTNFEQVTQDADTVYQGTGLGLAISKQLVEMMGGTISVTSIIGEGSTFSFHVMGQQQATTVAPRADKPAANKEISYNVILVEDLRINQMIMSKILHIMGHHVMKTCATGQEVLDYLKKQALDTGETNHGPDLILMDHQMPIMNGIEATQHIRTRQDRFKGIPIIALTADAFTEDRKKFEQAGMNGFISKPIDPQRVALEIERVMDL